MRIPELNRAECPATDQQFRPERYETFIEACGLKSAFIAHVKATHAPEKFPGLCHYKPPTRDVPFLLVVDAFEIDPAKRSDGEMIPCAACGTRKKFRRGSLAWYPQEGVLRVVGNECGDGRRSEAVAEYKHRTALTALNNYLLQYLPQISSFRADIATLRPAAEHAQKMSAHLRSNIRPFCEAVLTALKDGDGALGVLVQGQSGDSRRDGIRIVTHVPLGTDFLRNKYQPARKLLEADMRLAQAERGDEESAFAWQDANQSDRGILDACYTNLRSGLAKFGEARAQVRAASAFLSQANLRGIDNWANECGATQLRARWSYSLINFTAPPRRTGPQFAAALKPDWDLLALADTIGDRS